MTSCFTPAPQLCSKSLAIPDISAPRSASSACSIPGIRNSQLHPHVHCVRARRRLSLRSHPLDSLTPTPSFFPSKCSAVSSAASLSPGSRRLSARHSSSFHGISDRSRTTATPSPLGCDRCSANDWVVYSKPPFGGPEHVLRYLGRYTHRVAISNHRLVSLRRRQSHLSLARLRARQQEKLMTLALEEFLRRFLLHLLPKGFVRIRHFGFLANRRRVHAPATLLRLLGTVPSQIEPETSCYPGIGPSLALSPMWRTHGGHRDDLPPPNSNSVLHQCWSLVQHEIARPQLENSARFTALRPCPPCF